MLCITQSKQNWIIFDGESDPAWVRQRNVVMFTEIDTVTLDDPAPPVGASKTAVTKRIKGKQVNQTADSCNPGPEWVGHVRRIRDGQDQAAFAELFQYFAPRIKAFLMKSGSDAAMAEECAQEVMATLWHKAHLFDPSRATVATWVFTIARNLRIDRIGSRRQAGLIGLWALGRCRICRPENKYCQQQRNAIYDLSPIAPFHIFLPVPNLL